MASSESPLLDQLKLEESALSSTLGLSLIGFVSNLILMGGGNGFLYRLVRSNGKYFWGLIAHSLWQERWGNKSNITFTHVWKPYNCPQICLIADYDITIWFAINRLKTLLGSSDNIIDTAVSVRLERSKQQEKIYYEIEWFSILETFEYPLLL